jgi:hypothetical protein
MRAGVQQVVLVTGGPLAVSATAESLTPQAFVEFR